MLYHSQLWRPGSCSSWFWWPPSSLPSPSAKAHLLTLFSPARKDTCVPSCFRLDSHLGPQSPKFILPILIASFKEAMFYFLSILKLQLTPWRPMFIILFLYDSHSMETSSIAHILVFYAVGIKSMPLSLELAARPLLLNISMLSFSINRTENDGNKMAWVNPSWLVSNYELNVVVQRYLEVKARIHEIADFFQLSRSTLFAAVSKGSK